MKNHSTPDGQNAQSQSALIPSRAFADPTGAANWSQAGFGENDGAGAADLSRYLHALRRRWLVAIVVALPISATAAYAFWSFMPRLYTTTAILRLATNESTLIFETADVRGSANSFDVYKRTQRQLLVSRFVITHALRDESLAKLPAMQNERDPVEWLEKNLSTSHFPNESEVMQVSLAAGKPDGLNF